jgi:hypothetical protein
MEQIPPHFRDINHWSPIPGSEYQRLDGTLINHLRNMGVRMSKDFRDSFIENLLVEQNWTCAFGKNVRGKFCWNEPRDEYLPYLKLQWGHTKPKSRRQEESPDDLCLMCARCNNHIQSSRELHQLKGELLSKIEHIDAMISRGRPITRPLHSERFPRV